MAYNKRKYTENDKKKHRDYYLKNREEILARNKKYKEDVKKEDRFEYVKNPNTKKNLKIWAKIKKINKEIDKLKDDRNKNIKGLKNE